MGMRRVDQLSVLGGLFVVVLLVAAGWFLVISPKFAQADEVRATADDSSTQLSKLNKEAAALDEQEKKKPLYKAQLAVKQTALPNRYSIPSFVRQLQDIGNDLGVDVSGLTVGSPIKLVTVADAAELPITLKAAGTAANLSKFLTRLQTGQPRAVLIRSVAQTTDKESGNDTPLTDADISLSVFCLDPGDGSTAKDTCKVA